MNRFFVLLVAALALSSCSKIEPPASADGKAQARAPLSIVNWGPQETSAGVAANPLGDGSTGLYIVVSQSLDGMPVEVLVNGEPLGGVVVDGTTVTASLPPARFATPGQLDVALRVQAGETVPVGKFVVAAGGVQQPVAAGAAQELPQSESTAADTTAPAAPAN